MFKKFLNLSAAGLCRAVANRPTPPPLQRTYANKFLADPEDYANKFPVEPEDKNNQVVVYAYPIPPRHSYIRLIQEANQLAKRRKEAKAEEQPPIPKEIESKYNPKAAKCEEKRKGSACEQAKEEVKMTSKIPALGAKVPRRKTWHIVKKLEEAVAEDKKEESADASNSDKYMEPKFQQLKFEGIVTYRKPKADHGIKYEKVSATVRMHRSGKKP
ncbi:uncharacterized protein LOC111076173 [Drosophila obscura]|uniref:uncharacterized protein LOC111076173 n=1 Tax=Drosophila obscura TaxID=7282 RepID=UPI001BB21FE5|nr:uncharacterized protein LOC111076173 [Drosophila obscura]